MTTKKPRKVNAYRSKYEQAVATDLRKRKVDFEYEPLKLPFMQPETKHIYKPDFVLPNGIVVETKGRWDNDSRKKMVNVVNQYRGKMDIRMLFMRDQPLQKGAKKTYTEWCSDKNIKCAVGFIPQEWLDETEPDLG